MPDASPVGIAWWSRHLGLTKANRERLAQRYADEPIAFVAEDGGTIVGIVMGTVDELRRLFVRRRCQGQGIGQRLMERYERECRRRGSTRFRIVAALSAVPFYVRMGCKRTTGVRTHHGLPVQPMRKTLARAATPCLPSTDPDTDASRA
jgi:GNAT superfamily N-acetyltransferase